MKRVIFLIALLIPIISNAQGIRFEEGQSWQEILMKAKATNKYIFLDCYTTWCGPCKQMEKEVYSNQQVSDLCNDKFISVKIQMDTSKSDNELTKASYTDADYINKKYKINAYPSFLFFTPDGKFLNRREGAMEVGGFIKLVNDVINPKKNYYKLLDNYRQGKSDIAETGYLARAGIILGDTTTARKIAKAYIIQLKKQQWLIKDNIEFMREFTNGSNEKGFELFYNHADTINKIMKFNDYSQEIIHPIIYREVIDPAFVAATKLTSIPNWATLKAKIKKKYGEYYADRVIYGARYGWEYKQKNWAEYIKYYVLFIEKYMHFSDEHLEEGSMEDFIWNNRAWQVFQYSNKKEELTKALCWSGHALMMNPIANWMDTYANILYRLGREKFAISWEEVAAKLEPSDMDIQANLEKMRRKQPTWPLN